MLAERMAFRLKKKMSGSHEVMLVLVVDLICVYTQV